MKSIICSLIFLVCTITSSNAQNYQNVVCGNCRGAGGWISAYGPVYCQVCRGYGYVTVPVQNTTSFRGHNTNSCTTIPIYSFYNGCWNVVTQYGNYSAMSGRRHGYGLSILVVCVITAVKAHIHATFLTSLNSYTRINQV